MNKLDIFLRVWILLFLLLAGCKPNAATPASGDLRVLAVESYLADITQNVAGDRFEVETLVPLGLDPHAFEPTPRDVARISESTLLVANGAGFEEWLVETLQNAGGERQVIEAAAGLTSRTAREGEEVHDAEEENSHDEGDPHFWLDPLSVITYVENIRDGLIQADPEGQEIYTTNAAQYIQQLQELDRWIQEQVQAIPPEKRKIVTNHESFGYYADRYGFQIIGTVIPSVSTGASPSAQQLANLIDRVRAVDAQVIFLETGANPQLAEQLAAETGVKIVSDLHTHSLSQPGGPASTYLDMMRYNTQIIVDALR